MASILRIIILSFQCVFWWCWWLCHVTIPWQCLLCQLTVQILFYSLFICCSVCRHIWWVSHLKGVFQLFRKDNPAPRLICKEDNLNKNEGTWMIALPSVQLPRFRISVFFWTWHVFQYVCFVKLLSYLNAYAGNVHLR